MAIAKVSLNNLLLIAILASSSVNAASQDIKALQIKAGQGDIQASLELGKHFENAEGVEQNLGEALTYYRRAVLLGHSEEGSQRLTALRHRYDEIEKKQKAVTLNQNTISARSLAPIQTMKIIIHDAASQKPKIGLNALLSKDTAPHREASRVFMRRCH